VLALTPADLEAHRAAGPEGAARAARYGALWPAADSLGCRWLATGHTLDDQAETIVLQLLRGTGPDGLAGMPVRSGRLLRPLLGVRRSETHACCTATGLAWRDDPSNATDAPLRNRVRHHLLPLLEQLRPGATQTLARTATLAADERTWLEPLVAEAVDSAEHRSSPWPGAALDAAALTGLPVALARRVVRVAAARAGLGAPDAAATDRVLGLAGAAGGTRTAWPGGAAVRDARAIRLTLPAD
jgi:tRNA(Ile)-lysidine synthase